MPKREVDLEFVRQEYFSIQQSVEKFDEKALTIKAWSITLSMVGIGVAVREQRASIAGFAALSGLCFWVIDARWKSFQQAFYYRMKRIEKFMRGEEDEHFSSPDILGAWSAGWKATKLPKIMFWSQVYLPHLPIALIGFAYWFSQS